MLKEKMLPVSILCLSISIIISASVISKGMQKSGQHVGAGLTYISSGLNNIASSANNNNSIQSGDNTFDLLTAANYLGISQGKLIELTKATISGPPYVKVGDQYIFNKIALDKWLETVRLEIK
jgi:excisionase family DNA binding protein